MRRDFSFYDSCSKFLIYWCHLLCSRMQPCINYRLFKRSKPHTHTHPTHTTHIHHAHIHTHRKRERLSRSVQIGAFAGISPDCECSVRETHQQRKPSTLFSSYFFHSIQSLQLWCFWSLGRFFFFHPPTPFEDFPGLLCTVAWVVHYTKFPKLSEE